jgi:hypothetical protein
LNRNEIKVEEKTNTDANVNVIHFNPNTSGIRPISDDTELINPEVQRLKDFAGDDKSIVNGIVAMKDPENYLIGRGGIQKAKDF